MKFSWADYEEEEPNKTTTDFCEILKSRIDFTKKYTIPQDHNNDIPDKYNDIIERRKAVLNPIEVVEKQNPKPEREWSKVKRKKRKRNKCYTCFPRTHMKKYIITSYGKVQFHHDMCNRNIIIVTPQQHFTRLVDQSQQVISNFFSAIERFCLNNNITDYTVLYDIKQDATEHFHVKIKADERIIKQLRDDHFALKT